MWREYVTSCQILDWNLKLWRRWCFNLFNLKLMESIWQYKFIDKYCVIWSHIIHSICYLSWLLLYTPIIINFNIFVSFFFLSHRHFTTLSHWNGIVCCNCDLPVSQFVCFKLFMVVCFCMSGSKLCSYGRTSVINGQCGLMRINNHHGD